MSLSTKIISKINGVYIKVKNNKFILAVSITWFLIFIIEFTANFKLHSDLILKSLAQNISILDDKNDRYTDFLDYASAYFNKSASSNLYKSLLANNFKYNRENNIYELVQDKSIDTGALTSIKKLNNTKDHNEILNALELTPLFIQAKKLFPKSPWIYYSSENFIYIYPYVNSKEFKFSEEILKTEFHQNNLPQNNPNKTVIWTNPYFDLAGQGMMITKSKPIYVDNQFHGTSKIFYFIERVVITI